jgi:hypothetical protein
MSVTLIHAADGLMREWVLGIIAMTAAGAVVVALILGWWLFIHVYAEAYGKDLNSVWLVITSRYRRLGIALATLYAVAITAMILFLILSKFLR